MSARGFTLIELLITVAIVAVLASVALPLNELVVQRGKEAELRRSLREIREALDAYKQAFDEGRMVRRVGDSGYPRRLEDLVAGIEDMRDTSHNHIYFVRLIPRDTFAYDPNASAADAARQKLYASPPDAPRDGDDVFDVYTRSMLIGLNGRPLREW